MASFDVQEYELREKVENGDWNWIIPGKFLAFSNPCNTNSDHYGFYNYTPEDYAPLFKRMGITGIIRLNNRTYDEKRFHRQGLNHYDLFFTDGSVPPQDIVRRFLEISEQEQGALAVHCKAGLGRTGTLIGIYAMKHYGWDPQDFIAWNRICRPGSILGPQQQYLCDVGQSHAHLFNAQEEEIALHGDFGQAGRLMEAKKSNQNTPVKSLHSSPQSGTSQVSPFKSGTTGYRNLSQEPIPSPGIASPYKKRTDLTPPPRQSPPKSSYFTANYRNSPLSRPMNGYSYK